MRRLCIDEGTGWNTKIGARETNYGTRIDYVLVTRGLLPWIKAGDIQPSIKGSDHCPIFVDFHDEITSDTGERLVLRDLMHMREDAAKREPPRLAAKHWPEFQGKQTLMSSFFTKRGAETESPLAGVATTTQSVLAAAFDALDTQLPPPLAVDPPLSEASQPSSQNDTELSSSQPLVSPSSSQTCLKQPRTSHERHKRPRADASTTGASKPKKIKAGQSKLSSFFSMPDTATRPKASQRTASSSEIIDLCEDSEEVSVEASSMPIITSEIRLPSDTPPTNSQCSENENGTTTTGTAAARTGSSWSALFTPIPVPLCTVHREPAKEWRVNKPGPNKGKTFYLCARPVGPGYDKGRNERRREEVDHQYKCDFFKWASDVKREVMRAGAGATASSGT